MKYFKMNKRRKNNYKGLLKWFILIIGTLLLFMAGSRQAFHQRGYEAIGGEVFILLIPAVYQIVSQMVKDLKEEIINDFKRI